MIYPGGATDAQSGAAAPDPIAVQLVKWTKEQNKAKQGEYVVKAKEADDGKTELYSEERDYF